MGKVESIKKQHALENAVETEQAFSFYYAESQGEMSEGGSKAGRSGDQERAKLDEAQTGGYNA
jgi:hypothetical protein